MANLMPDAEAVANAGRALLEELFARPAADRGCPRWGFKETLYGRPVGEDIRELFPSLRVVHITRDPRAVLASLHTWELDERPRWGRSDTKRALRDWVAVNESFIGAPAELPWVASHRYEQVLADPVGFTRELGGFLGLDADRMDPEVFALRLHGTGEAGRAERDVPAFEDLPRSARALLDDERLRAAAAAYGYEL
jgi:hypothetical protein